MTDKNRPNRRELLRKAGQFAAGGMLAALGGALLAAQRDPASPNRPDGAENEAQAKLASCINRGKCSGCSRGPACPLTGARTFQARHGRHDHE